MTPPFVGADMTICDADVAELEAALDGAGVEPALTVDPPETAPSPLSLPPLSGARVGRDDVAN